jgi:hypothetical protein
MSLFVTSLPPTNMSSTISIYGTTPTFHNDIVIRDDFHRVWTELLHHLRVVAHHAVHHISQRIFHGEVDAIHKL